MFDLEERAYSLMTHAIIARLSRLYVDDGSPTRTIALQALAREAKRQEISDLDTALYDVQSLLEKMYPFDRPGVAAILVRMRETIDRA